MKKTSIAEKALSLRQPYAWALFHGKPVENRNWRTSFRGRIFIHASLKFDMEGFNWIVSNAGRLGITLPEPCLRDMASGTKLTPAAYFHRGAIIGDIELTDCVDHYNSPWFFGKFGLVMKDPFEYPMPIPCKGTIFPKFFVPDIPRWICMELPSERKDFENV